MTGDQTQSTTDDEIKAALAILRQLHHARAGLGAQRARLEREIARLGGLDNCASDVPGMVAALAAKITEIESQIVELRLAIGLDRSLPNAVN